MVDDPAWIRILYVHVEECLTAYLVAETAHAGTIGLLPDLEDKCESLP